VQLRPDQGSGLFIAYNSDEAGFLDQVLGDFNDHYDPLPPASSRALAPGAAEALSRFTGTYRLSDYARTTLSKVLLLASEDLPQVVPSGNSVGIRWLADGPDQPEPLVQLEPLVFASQDGRFRFTFLQDRNESITGMVWGHLFVLEKVPWYKTVAFQRGVFAMFLIGFATAALVWPLSALIPRLFKRNRVHLVDRADARVGTLAAAGVAINAALNATFLLALLIILPRAFDLGLQFGMPPLLGALFSVPILTTGLALALATLTFPMVRTHAWRLRACLAYCLYTIFALAFAPFLLYWNLLGLRW